MAMSPFPIEPELCLGVNYELKMHSAAFHSIEVEFLRLLMWAARSRAYNTIVELGVAEGYASWWLFQSIKNRMGKIYLVDTTLDSTKTMDLLGPSFDSQIKMYKGSTVDFFKIHEPRKKFDLIVIDANHDYNACVEDFELAREAISEGGIIAVHDVNYLPGCVQAIKELEPRFPGTWMHYPCGKGLSLYEPGTGWESR